MNTIKKERSVLILLILLISISCTYQDDKLGEFNLLPQPQEFNISGISTLKHGDIQKYFSKSQKEIPVGLNLLEGITFSSNVSKAQLVFEIDESIDVKAEGYTINISANKVIIIGKDKAGLFYGLKSFEQLLIDAKEQNVKLPLCIITDYPKLAYRAIHLDIKHHLEKTSYYYELMDKLAGYKVNALIVEMEDKIKYKRRSKIGSEDALSIDEWKKLSTYAYERNISISPLIQGLGHSSFILKHDKYNKLRDDPESDWAFNPLDPKTYELQFDLYLDAIDATPHGKYLHIGGDEVYTTGRNSGKSSLELQLIWLDKVSKFVEKYNRIPIFWDDMPLKQAGVYKAMFDEKLTEEEVDQIWEENEHKLLEFLDLFPKNCIYMRWNYNSSDAIGNGKSMEWFRNHGMQVMGATAGQTRWVLMPQKESNIDNIRAFSISSINKNLNGLLLTLWDDDSPHFELYMRGIIAFSEYTWSGDKRSKSTLKAAYRHREFSNELSSDEFGFIDKLEKPVAFWKNALLNGNSRNYLKKHKDAIQKLVIDLPNNDKKGKWTKKHENRLKKASNVVKYCDSISLKIDIMKSKANRNIYTLEVYEQVNKLVRFSCNALLKLKKYDIAKSKQDVKNAMKDIKSLSNEFDVLRKEFETVYGKTRILNKPENYILDQDHHVHLANQSINFDWQFLAEMLFLDKIRKEM
ncbi:family 20 glycosylhydrolase [Flavicella sp.]|uniref:family 20 glycosylhydrolase n=1 Tax=Flavicella sp. TaxID=2957742 RepID=UPI0030158EC0